MKIVVYTLGCKVNQYESDCLVLALSNLGHDVFTKLTKADIYILNSCAVTNEAEKKSRQMIKKFNDLNENAKIMVCGCASEKNADQFKDLKNVTFVSGTANKLALIEKWEQKKVAVEALPSFYDDNYVSVPTKTRAYIKIQDGCNNFCSYCIIPYLRGRSRSRNIISILNEVENLSKLVKEIVITGINIKDYKIDEELSLSVLLKQLEPYKDIRFRLGSLEQGLVDKTFIDACKTINICPHFHLSLQSGSETVLKRMNRKYTPNEFLKSVKMLRKNYKNPNITTDVIVGFPMETDREFKKTVKFIKKVKFSNLHIFPYSKRSGTVAEKMHQIDGNVKKLREKILEKLNKKLNKNYIKSCKNKVYSVLIETHENGYAIGYTENYIKCYIKDNIQISDEFIFLENNFYNVKIKKQYKDGATAV